MTIQADENQNTLGKDFIHEAGHALAFDLLGVPLEFVSVTTFDDSIDNRGLTKLANGGADLRLPEFAFAKMTGPAAHLFLGVYQFDSERNKFASDFCEVVRKFPSINAKREEKAFTLLSLYAYLDGFCKEWVIKRKESLLCFATRLQSSHVRKGYFELRDEPLQTALQKARGTSCPVTDEVNTTIEKQFLATWEATKHRTQRMSEVPLWVEEYLYRIEHPQ
jgi:hypothetical protein